MKFSKPQFLKKKYKFEYSHEDNLNPPEVKKIYDLISFFKNKNFEYLQDYKKGSVVVTKITNNQFAEVIAMQKIELPVDEKMDWTKFFEPLFADKPMSNEAIDEFESSLNVKSLKEIEELVESFPIKKNVYEQVEEKADSVTMTTEKHRATPAMLEEIEQATISEENTTFNLSDFLVKPKTNLVKEESKVIGGEPVVETVDWGIDDEIPSSTEEKASQLPDDIELHQEIEGHEEVETSNVEENHPTMTDFIKKYESVPTVEQPKEIVSSGFSDETVTAFVNQFQNNTINVVTDYLEKENKKIVEEVKALDKRSLIPQEVENRYKPKQIEAENAIVNALAVEKQQLIQAENIRHEQALKDIEIQNNATQTDKLNAVRLDFKRQISYEIKLQVDKETKHLENVLEGKKSELELRKEALTQGLTFSFQQGVTAVNTGQDRIMEELDNIKKPNIINLDSARKAM